MKVKEALDTLTEDEWKEIDAAVEQVAPTKPANAFTTKEFCARHGYKRNKGSSILLELAKKGVIKKCGGGSQIYYVKVKK